MLGILCLERQGQIMMDKWLDLNMKKPTVQLTGHDGNVFAIIARMVAEMNRQGFVAEAKEFSYKAFSAKSYNDVLVLCTKYADIT